MSRRQRIEDLTTFAVPEQPALSPDASRIVYVLRTCDAQADRAVRSLWRVGVREGEPQQLTRGLSEHVDKPGRRTDRASHSCAARTGQAQLAVGATGTLAGNLSS